MKRLLPPLLLSLLGACSQQSPAPDSGIDAPGHWLHANDQPVPAQEREWWRSFAGSELERLVDQALADSHDLAAASARVRQAEASARLAGAPLLPRLDGNLGASREGRLGGNPDPAGNAYQANLAASYEVDLWGRLRATSDSAELNLRASRFDYQSLRIGLAASVANAWLQRLGLDERRRLAEQDLATAERLLATVEARWNAGAALPLELAQQRGLVASQKRLLADIDQQRDDAHTALALLLGRHVGELPTPQTDLADLATPSLGAGLPSELLGRRPDLARAEAGLAAADADVAAARAAMLPRLDLSARAGGGANSLSRVLADPVYSLAAALTSPIFDAGRLAAERDSAIARREELLADYRTAIVAAFADVETALNAQSGTAARETAQQEVLLQARESLRLAEARYRAGAVTLLELLDSQRTLYAAQEQMAQLQVERLQASVALYRALGGGWQL